MRQEKPTGGKTILLADDEPQIRSILYDLLINSGYNVIEAVDGLDALEKYKNNIQDIKLVITDIIMPRMDGISSYRIMNTITPSLKVIFISGYASDQTLPDGANIFAKPFSPIDVLKAVNSILSN